jgi:hypothetical protein
MSRWSEEAARRSRERREAKYIAERKAQQDKELLASKGRALWISMKSLLVRKCEEFNAEPGNKGVLWIVANPADVTIHCEQHGGVITGTFADNAVVFSGKSGVAFAASLYMRFTRDGTDIGVMDDAGRPVDFEDVANEMIETLLEASGW